MQLLSPAAIVRVYLVLRRCSLSTEFSRLLQKQAEVLTNAAQAIQATATTQKKNQQLQQLARIKMTIEA